MFDAREALHPEDVPVDAMFLDQMHPTVRGHEALARGLAGFLSREGLAGGR